LGTGRASGHAGIRSRAGIIRASNPGTDLPMPIRLAPLAAAALLVVGFQARAQTPAAGLDPRHLDTRTAACNDFYQHANGGWLKANPVPAGRASWGLLDEMAERNLLQQREILEAAASTPKDDLDRLLGALYAAGMDEAAIEAAGAQPLAPLLQRIERLKKPKDFAPLLADLHARGLPVLFDFGVNDDLNDPSRRIAYANQGGLGLPDRDYYLRQEPQTKTLLAAYRAYVERVLTLTGSTSAARDADTILQIETRLAKASLSLVQLRDPKVSYRPTRIKELRERFPTLNWKVFLKAQDLARLDSLSLAHTSFFAEVEALGKTLTPEQWRAYSRTRTRRSTCARCAARRNRCRAGAAYSRRSIPCSTTASAGATRSAISPNPRAARPTPWCSRSGRRCARESRPAPGWASRPRPRPWPSSMHSTSSSATRRAGRTSRVSRSMRVSTHPRYWLPPRGATAA
jgi:hypothetical protein